MAALKIFFISYVLCSYYLKGEKSALKVSRGSWNGKEVIEWFFDGPSYFTEPTKALIQWPKANKGLGEEYKISLPVFVLSTSSCNMF